MKHKSVHSCRFFHHAKFHCIMTTLNQLFKIEFEGGTGNEPELLPLKRLRIILTSQMPAAKRIDTFSSIIAPSMTIQSRCSGGGVVSDVFLFLTGSRCSLYVSTLSTKIRESSERARPKNNVLDLLDPSNIFFDALNRRNCARLCSPMEKANTFFQRLGQVRVFQLSRTNFMMFQSSRPKWQFLSVFLVLSLPWLIFLNFLR